MANRRPSISERDHLARSAQRQASLSAETPPQSGEYRPNFWRCSLGQDSQDKFQWTRQWLECRLRRNLDLLDSTLTSSSHLAEPEVYRLNGQNQLIREMLSDEGAAEMEDAYSGGSFEIEAR